MVQEVHDEALDVGAIVVLIRHDHQMPIAQLLRAVIHLRRHVLTVTAQPMTYIKRLYNCQPVLGSSHVKRLPRTGAGLMAGTHAGLQEQLKDAFCACWISGGGSPCHAAVPRSA